MTYKHAQEVVHKPTGSRGKVNLWMKQGVYLVNFEEKDWRGEPELVKRGRVSINVNEKDLEAV